MASTESELVRFLRERLSGWGDNGRFARRAGIQTSAISKWLKGQPPNFESCLKIAKYFELDPYRVFEMNGKPEYSDLARAFGIRGEAPGRPDPVEVYPEHARLHESLQALIEAGCGERAVQEIERASEALGTIWELMGDLMERIGAARGLLLSEGRTLFRRGGQDGCATTPSCSWRRPGRRRRRPISSWGGADPALTDAHPSTGA